MATAKKNIVPAETGDRVEVFIPRGAANDDPNYFVSVNGVNYLLPRGKKSLVPKHIADEIRRSEMAQEALDARMQAMIDEAANL